MTIPNDFDGGLLSRDPAVGERYLADRLNQHRTTTRFGAEALGRAGPRPAALGRLTLPTLVIHGEADRLVPTASSEVLGGAAERDPTDVPGAPSRDATTSPRAGGHRRRRRLAAATVGTKGD